MVHRTWLNVRVSLPLILGDLHPHDLATALDYEGVAVRAGHHCAQPCSNIWMFQQQHVQVLYLQYQGRLR